MSIYEYDAEKHMRQEKEESWEDGHRLGLEEGHRRGVEEGRRFGLEKGRLFGREEILKEFRRKLKKGLTLSEIADMLEEEEETVKRLMKEKEE